MLNLSPSSSFDAVTTGVDIELRCRFSIFRIHTSTCSCTLTLTGPLLSCPWCLSGSPSPPSLHSSHHGRGMLRKIRPLQKTQTDVGSACVHAHTDTCKITWKNILAAPCTYKCRGHYLRQACGPACTNTDRQTMAQRPRQTCPANKLVRANTAAGWCV